MPHNGTIFLMYHELELPERKLCNPENGYLRYVISDNIFLNQMMILKERGFNGINVSQSLKTSTFTQSDIVITFDDGCETDFIAAAPILKNLNFNATFYVIAGFIGQKGFLSKSQVKELSDLGFEIGSHSMTHQYLPNLDRESLKSEILHSKSYLEQIIGKSVDHFSCPGGRWNNLVSEIVAASGYQTMATSRIGVNHPHSNPYSLSRIRVVKDTTPQEFMKICMANSIAKLQIQDTTLSIAKVILGNKFYENLRNKLLTISSHHL